MTEQSERQVDYWQAYHEGMQSGARPADCPYRTDSAQAWAWLDGLWATRDATREETLRGETLIWAVYDPLTDVYRSLHRYPGEAYEAASELADSASVSCLHFNAALLEPDLNEEVLDMSGNPLPGHPMTWDGEHLP